MNTWAKYTVVETSTGKFRIVADYGNGMTLFVGGKKSRKFCFWLKEEAEKMAAFWNEQSDKMTLFEKEMTK
jgi:hypothetical protein